MKNDNDRSISYQCPYCQYKKIETAATAPYIRGMILAYQYGTKNFIGCTSCVRKKIFGEVCLSILIGWFSISALFINPILIIYNLIRLPFIQTNYTKARKKLVEIGIPEDHSLVDITRLGYSLAASMIAIDGKIKEEEVAMAKEIGKKILPDFNDNEFNSVFARAGELSSPEDIAALLREVLSLDGKRTICLYLWMIAFSDGSVDDSEKELLIRVADKMDFDVTNLKPND